MQTFGKGRWGGATLFALFYFHGLFFLSFVRYTLSEHDCGACKHNIKKVLKAFANTNILEWSNIEPFTTYFQKLYSEIC